MIGIYDSRGIGGGRGVGGLHRFIVGRPHCLVPNFLHRICDYIAAVVPIGETLEAALPVVFQIQGDTSTRVDTVGKEPHGDGKFLIQRWIIALGNDPVFHYRKRGFVAGRQGDIGNLIRPILHITNLVLGDLPYGVQNQRLIGVGVVAELLRAVHATCQIIVISTLLVEDLQAVGAATVGKFLTVVAAGGGNSCVEVGWIAAVVIESDDLAEPVGKLHFSVVYCHRPKSVGGGFCGCLVHPLVARIVSVV